MNERLLLTVIIAVAAALRFTALGWGLRHLPHVDERFFVENVDQMLAAGDLNHRFYEYPALFSYLLGVVLVVLPEPRTGPDAYFAARAVNASFGVASVILTYLLGRRMAGPRAGLFAAALLAVSPAEVRTAHVVRPDVTLHPFMLLALMAFTGVGTGVKGDVLSGAAIGVATAVKFSAPLIAPAYLARRLAAAGFRWWKPLLAAVVSVGVFTVLSPFTFIGTGSTLAMWKQVRYHYHPRPGALELHESATAYGSMIVSELGAVGVLLAVAGMVVWRLRWREWIPLLVLPLTFVAVFSTAVVRAERFLIPCLGAVCVLAGVAVQGAAAWRSSVGLGLALAALATPLLASAEYVRAISRPTTKDVAADWIEANYPQGARVLVTAASDVGLDRTRFEITRLHRIRGASRACLGEHDLLILGLSDRNAISQMQRIQVIRPTAGSTGRTLLLLAPSPAQRRQYVAVDLPPAVSVADGSVELRFREPVVLGRIEIFVGAPSSSLAEDLDFSVFAPESQQFGRVSAVACRPPLDQQVAPRSHVFVLNGVRAQALRITSRGRLPARALGRLDIRALQGTQGVVMSDRLNSSRSAAHVDKQDTLPPSAR